MENVFDLDGLTNDDLLALTEIIFDRLEVQDLVWVRSVAEEKWKDKREAAKNAVIAEMKGKFDTLGLSLEEAMGLTKGRRTRRENGSMLPTKYRGPNGETWSGRGFAPQWLRVLEDEGHDRENYRIGIEQAS